MDFHGLSKPIRQNSVRTLYSRFNMSAKPYCDKQESTADCITDEEYSQTILSGPLTALGSPGTKSFERTPSFYTYNLMGTHSWARCLPGPRTTTGQYPHCPLPAYPIHLDWSGNLTHIVGRHSTTLAVYTLRA